MSDEQQLPPPESMPAPRPTAWQRFPTWPQALVMFFGGLVLFVSACFGCLFTFGNKAQRDLFMLLYVGAYVGLGIAGIGILLGMLRFVRAVLSLFKRN